ncbi:MAG: class B sortase [Oscillospiraceae bacterium]|nr:class B sortase [Oscillospiraceae bacterium]
MKNITLKQILAIILAAAITAALAACASEPEPAFTEPDPAQEPQIADTLPAFINILPIPTAASEVGVVNNGFHLLAREKFDENSDTVGWLNIPGTVIDDPIVWYPGDVNAYYLYRDFNKTPVGTAAGNAGNNYLAAYFADFRSNMRDGTNNFTRNTTIYGHNVDLADNPDGRAFAQLLKFLDEDFARKTPYIYFSTTEEDFAWEVFAVFYALVDGNFNYHRPNDDLREFESVIVEGVLPRSIYNYEGGVTADDKIIALSTCTYTIPIHNISFLGYPNNYRYVVMAKLVKPGHATLTEARFTVNPSPKAP